MNSRRRNLFALVLVGGPVAGLAAWLLFDSGKGQPTSASFWFAVFASFGLGAVVGLAATRRIGEATLYGIVTTSLAVTTWLVCLLVFFASDRS